MRNFILFIRRFFNLILFFALEIICVILIEHSDSIQGNDIISSANAVAGIVYQKQNDVVYYFGLRKMNDSLVNENMRLRTVVDKYHSRDTLHDSLVHKPIAGDTSVHVVQYANYIYRTARVINNSVASSDNYITLDRGYDDGIRKDMAVISSTGVVGRVMHVSKHFASVISILSVRQKVSAKLKDGTYSSVYWDGENPDRVFMKDVPQQNNVKKGDSVFTTSYSFFPPDVLIGTVQKMETNKKNNLQLLYLAPSTNFRNIQYVYVVENLMAGERKQLEDSVKTKK